MRRALIAGLICMGLIAAAPAAAHPLGNFSINHLVSVRVSSDGVDLHYILDQAEIPTFQERSLSSAAIVALTSRITSCAWGVGSMPWVVRLNSRSPKCFLSLPSAVCVRQRRSNNA